MKNLKKLFFVPDGHAGARYEIDIPDIADYGDKQHEDIKTAFAYVVHTADNQRD